MPHPVASKGHVEICEVRSPPLPHALQIGFNFLSGRLDQRPNRVTRDRRHGDQPFPARTPHEMKQKRFDAIFLVVSQSDLGVSMLPDESAEEVLPRLAACNFDIAGSIANRLRMCEAGNIELC